MANLHEQNVQPAWPIICSVEEQREVIRRPTNKKRYEDKENNPVRQTEQTTNCKSKKREM
jgi:hypothetical protein